MNLKTVTVLMLLLLASACERTPSDAQPAANVTAAPAQEQIAAVDQVMSSVVEQAAVDKATVEKAVDEVKSQVTQTVASIEAGKPLSGEAIYKKTCVGCHASGAANAPKLGDKAAWKPRIAKGMNVLLQSAINGVPGTAMMKRGTCISCSDDDLKSAIEYMVAQSK